MDARLEPYRVVVSFLGEALGPDYEVVLHDLTSEDGTIVAIVNNHISGRTEGAPLSNMALRFIQERMYEKQDYLAGYQGASQAKGRLRSSTMFIKDEAGEMVVSKLNEEMLARIADITGGAYVRSSKQSIGLDEIVKAINEMEQTELSTVRFEEFNEQYQYLLIAALVLLLLEFVVLDRRNPLLAHLNIFREK